MAKLEQLDRSRVPQHVAIIMDGNGRWAKSQGYDRSVGHKAGVDALHRTLEAAQKAGVKWLTAYTFSTENWNRPKQEVDTLMNLIAWAIERETEGMVKNGVCLKVVGDMNRLPDTARTKLIECMANTAKGDKITMVLILSYSSRWEIADTARRLAKQAVEGKIKPEDIDERLFNDNLRTQGMPDPDLLIRTGGELRISNYLLWQISYSEIYVTDVAWPDFDKEELRKACEEYSHRTRRFGKISEEEA